MISTTFVQKDKVAMSTVVSLVNSTPLHSGISDGYRRSQLGNPTSSVGQAPKFRGEVNNPGSNVKAPKILSSAARHNRATNVTIPYARVCSSEDLVNKGRLSRGDVAFIARSRHGLTGHTQLNHEQKRQIITSASTPHANISRLVGLDYINRGLGIDNYKAGATVLVDSLNPLDDWRSLSFLNKFTLDGIVLSNDSPGYIESTSNGTRNDQLFNIGIQGPVQLNNGYENDNGGGVASHYEGTSGLGAGHAGKQMTVEALIGGPFYSQYPIQMFDRNIRPLSDLYIGLICKKINGTELDEIRNMKSTYYEQFNSAKHIHVFEYRCFSSRQISQFATVGDDPDGDLDFDVVETGSAGPGRSGKRKRDEIDSFSGIKQVDVKHMVGAWRIGKVLDVASQRQQGYNNRGPIDTSFSVTLNFDLSFLDWRQLRRNFTMNIFGYNLEPDDKHWLDFGLKNGGHYRFEQDSGRVLQWPTRYMLPNEDDNIPINPNMIYKLLGHQHEWEEDLQAQRESYNKQIEMYKNSEDSVSVSNAINETSPDLVPSAFLGGTTPAPAPTPAPTPPPTPPLTLPFAPALPKPIESAPELVQKAPKATSKSVSKKPATTVAIGEKLMADIFTGAMPDADLGESGDSAASHTRSDTSAQAAEKPKSFQRRRDR